MPLSDLRVPMHFRFKPEIIGFHTFLRKFVRIWQSDNIYLIILFICLISRSGRTGRAGRLGTSVVLYAHADDEAKLRKMELLGGFKFKELTFCGWGRSRLFLFIEWRTSGAISLTKLKMICWSRSWRPKPTGSNRSLSKSETKRGIKTNYFRTWWVLPCEF